LAEKILIVEDDESISELIEYNLQAAGFDTVTAFDGKTGLELAETEAPDLVLLDVMLPGMDGWDVCRELRRKSNVPVLFLTALDAEFDRVLGLELGADDYITKPFSPRELVARVKAVLRRANPQPAPSDVIERGQLRVDLRQHTVHVAGEQVQLTPMEYQLLSILVRDPGKVYSREQLLTQVLGEEFFGDQRTVDVHISHLREKLGPMGNLIQTVRGFGYKLKE
jgi:two-component system alkaline phosphatase synthesis response regulator PhoP